MIYIGAVYYVTPDALTGGCNPFSLPQRVHIPSFHHYEVMAIFEYNNDCIVPNIMLCCFPVFIIFFFFFGSGGGVGV